MDRYEKEKAELRDAIKQRCDEGIESLDRARAIFKTASRRGGWGIRDRTEFQALMAEAEALEEEVAILKNEYDRCGPSTSIAVLGDRNCRYNFDGTVTYLGNEGKKEMIYKSIEGPYRNQTLGDFLVDVRMAGTPGQQPPQRLYEARATGLSEATGSEGGFLVQADFSNQLIKSVFATGKLAEFCTKFEISGPSNTLKLNAFNETSRATGSRLGGVQGYWAAEAGEKTASKPDFRQLVLELKKMVGLVYATDELLADAAALERVIRQGFADEFGFMLDDAIVNGTGAGRPLGILNSPCLVTVNKETGQAAATIQVENLLKMWARCTNPEKAHWLVNRDIIPQLYTMGITVGTGGSPIFMPAGGISGQPFNTILGRPVIAIEQAATLGTVGDIILADLSAYILADKGGVQAASSIHVRFVYDESCFRFVYRVDGQPLYASAITPFKGASTLSPFVVLQTRS